MKVRTMNHSPFSSLFSSFRAGHRAAQRPSSHKRIVSNCDSKMKMMREFGVLCLLITTAGRSLAASPVAPPLYYAEPPLFSYAPDPEKAGLVEHFGPVGLEIDLIQPAFTMRIKSIEEGSPAALTGKLKPGQIIESINGAKLKDIDPRIQLGNFITDAEATDGVLRLMVADKPEGKAEEVIVKIPVLGAYSKTWPLNCPKSDKIVRGYADYLATPKASIGFGGIGMLFLLGTGEDKDLEQVRTWVNGLADKQPSRYSWHLGYGGIPLCEYYLRTGDKSALPTIQKWVDSAVAGEYFGGWSHKGVAGAVHYGGGGGHLNGGGTGVVTFLMLAKECGVNVPDPTFNRVLTHFFRWAGRGNNPYGDGRPEHGFVDNGKNGNLAFAMASAAALTPGGEDSIYARASEAAAMSGFYSTAYMLHGHTGGGVGEIWRSASMGLLHKKKPTHYRNFMDGRRWHYELSRGFDGSFSILGGGYRYDNVEWGAGYALTYIIPRQTLRIAGAPPTRFSKQYKLPERPWGTKADDAFTSMDPAAFQDGTIPDFSGETLANDSGKSLLVRLSAADVDDATLRRYAHHPNTFVRFMAARKVMGINSTHLGKPTVVADIRAKLGMELFHSSDPRVRRAILEAIAGRLAGEELMNFIGQDGFDKLIAMLRDPEESLWVKDACLQLVGLTTADAVIPHVDLLLSFLTHDEWWLQNAALSALTPVVADERSYRKVIPAMGEMVKNCQLFNATAPLRWGGPSSKLRLASPEIQKLAADSFAFSYANYTGQKVSPNGLDTTRVYDSQLLHLGTMLTGLEGGYDLLYKLAKERFPNEPLPYSEIFLSADPDKFGPELKKIYSPLVRNQLIPTYIASNYKTLLSDANSGARNSKLDNSPGPIGKLVHLYNQIGVDDYNYHDFGPTRDQMKWNYHTFEPAEKLGYKDVRWRFRTVSYPPGMENWFASDFDAAKAGWKSGAQPFGQFNGKLMTGPKACHSDFCRCGDLPKTLWDKEVLLLNGKFQFPKFREGYRYRLLIGGMSHVGAGDGYRVYINGKPLVERDFSNSLSGGAPHGCMQISKEWWPEFDREVTISAISFLAYGSKKGPPTDPVPQGHFSLWLQEMKVPPINDGEILRAASVVSMLSSEWQSLQDPGKDAEDPEEGKFRWDGKFTNNAKVLGSWTQLGQVNAIEDFKPSPSIKNTPGGLFQQMTFQDQGKTGGPLRIWSGDVLMDVESNQARKLEVKTIEDVDYLFIEAGEFSVKKPLGWRSPWYVLKRATK